jgi:hypothetical protein
LSTIEKKTKKKKVALAHLKENQTKGTEQAEQHFQRQKVNVRFRDGVPA